MENREKSEYDRHAMLSQQCKDCLDFSIDGNVGFNYVPEKGTVNLVYCDKAKGFIAYKNLKGLCNG